MQINAINKNHNRRRFDLNAENEYRFSYAVYIFHIFNFFDKEVHVDFVAINDATYLSESIKTF